MRLPGRPGRYPTRDEITDYLRGYAARFDLPVRTRSRVGDVAWDGRTFQLALPGGDRLAARAVVAASGGFGRPHIPDLPGLTGYTGTLLHAAGYRRPEPFTGQRVVVVGAGNSAVQIAVELAEVATVTLASRQPVRFRPQRPLGLDLHYWARWSGLEALPIHRDGARSVGVLDDGRYAAALAAGRPDRRPMFDRLTSTGVVWSDGTEEPVDAVILATGYRPDVGYLAGLGALNSDGWPVHCRGRSLTVPRLGYVGLPGQTGLASATVRGVGGDARRIARWLRRTLTQTPSICPSRPPAASPPWPTDEPRPRRPDRAPGRPGRRGLGAARVLAEAVGTGLLVCAVIGSGIAAQRLSPDDVGLQLLENAIATGTVLAVLIVVLQPVSAAFNPVVTVLERATGVIGTRQAVASIAAQLAGGVAGAVLANLMFGEPPVTIAPPTGPGRGSGWPRWWPPPAWFLPSPP